MIIVVDASVLVAELLRVRGRALLRDPRLDVAITEEQQSEVVHEIGRRLHSLSERVQFHPDQIKVIREHIEAVIKTIDVVPRHTYSPLESVARRRIPRDSNDWPTVALAIALGADILTNDHDFLGCGCATWTFETLRDELTHGDWPR
jgi:predicted nucleic acid-binding protein